MSRSLPRTLAVLAVTFTVLLAEPIPATSAQSGSRCQRTTERRLAVLGDAAQRCMATCWEEGAAGASRLCTAAAPDVEFRRCLRRPLQRARERIRRACRDAEPPLDDFVRTVLSHETCGNGVLDEGEACDPLRSPTGCDAGMPCTAGCTSCGAPLVCGDGTLGDGEPCDESAPANGGCPDGQRCFGCVHCAALCGDGNISGGEICEPQAAPNGCPAGEECVGCYGCGRAGPPISAEEDVSPCANGVGDRWAFDVEGGTTVRVVADTVDGATAAAMGLEATCAPAPLYGFRAALGFPCTFTPPNDPGRGGRGCPEWSFVAPVSGSCLLTVGARPDLDVGDGNGCSDPTIARYRLSVTGTGLTLVGDDVPPGLSSDR